MISRARGWRRTRRFAYRGDMKPSAALLPGFLLGLAFPSLAQADVPPGPDYVERCTVEAQGAGMECVLCGDAYHGDHDACEKKYGPGLERRCRTSGASVWKEVWCKKSAAAPPVTPAVLTRWRETWALLARLAPTTIL